MRKKNITFVLKNDLTQLKDLCGFCEKLGKTAGLSEKFIFQTNLALDELFTNIVSYGFGDQKEHQIVITIGFEQDTLNVCIEDDGAPFDPVSAPATELGSSIQDARVGGLGIHLIKNLMDEISYERVNGRNVLRMKKYLCSSRKRKSERA